MQTNSPPKLDNQNKTKKKLPLSRKILSPPKQNILKTFLNKIPPDFIYFCPFLSRIDKDNSDKEEIDSKHERKKTKEPQNSSFIENRGNSPYEEQQCFKNKLLSPYK